MTLADRAPHIRMTRPERMAMDAQGNLYVASAAEGRVRVFGPGGDSLGLFALRLKVSGPLLPGPVRLGRRPLASLRLPTPWHAPSAAGSAALSGVLPHVLPRILGAGTLAGRLEAPILLGRHRASP